jgi:carboxyl-terminal processing protease
MRLFQTNSNRSQFYLGLFLIIFLAVMSFIAGVLTSRYLPFVTKGEYSVLLEARSVLDSHFLEELPSSRELEYGMIQGMLNKINDPYTVFVEPVQHELQTNQLAGKFGGIGARLERDPEGHLLLFPFPGSPAEEAGISEGARLVSVEELVITPEMSFDEIQAAIRGPVGEKLELVIASSPDYQTKTVFVERQEIALPSVTWNLAAADERVGVIQVNIIAATTPEEVSNAILDLKDLGADHFILDLRNNSGGLLTAGIDTAELFLSKSVVLQQQYRGKPVESILNETDGVFLDIPLVILVNRGSASAAEVIAGALQSQSRAIVVGSNTYGKDSIQLVFDLSDGSSLHVTSAKWWIPGMPRTIGQQGITPDIPIPEEQTLEPSTLQTAVDAVLQSSGNLP